MIPLHLEPEPTIFVSAKLSERHKSQPIPVDWLWPNIIPRGRLTLLAGPPSLGKSFIALDLAARLSRGLPMPFATPRVSTETADPTPDPAPATPPRSPPPPRNETLLFAAEDHIDDTLRARLATLGGDQSRIHLHHGVVRHDDKHPVPIDLLRDFDAFSDFVLDQPQLGLIIFDPLPFFLRSSPQYVRDAILRLNTLAEVNDLAIIAITHTTHHRRRAYHEVVGPSTYTTASRLIWEVSLLPDGRTRALSCAKANLYIPNHSYTFTLDAGQPRWQNVAPNVTPPTPLRLHDPAELYALEEARLFLSVELARRPRPAMLLSATARTIGIAKRTLDRAKRDLGVESECKLHKGKNLWFWRLRGGDCQTPSPLGNLLTPPKTPVSPCKNRPSSARKRRAQNGSRTPD